MRIVFVPFSVPDHVDTLNEAGRPRKDGLEADSLFKLSDLPGGTLDALAAAWLVSLYRKAGRQVDMPILAAAIDEYIVAGEKL